MSLTATTGNFDASLDQIARLVSYFTTNRQAYVSADYKEAQIRQNLIDPLFIALGWDVHNSLKIAPQYCPVLMEPSLDMEGQMRAPDYAFRAIDFNDPADKARHDQMVTLVQQMLELHKRLQAVHSDQDRQLYQRQIDATDKQIDALVYELYNLTGDEIKIVEGAM